MSYPCPEELERASKLTDQEYIHFAIRFACSFTIIAKNRRHILKNPALRSYYENLRPRLTKLPYDPPRRNWPYCRS